MFIPLGHDQLTLRRVPVVCFTIMALCVVVHMAGMIGSRPNEEEANEKLRAAVTYYVEHPSLDANPRLRPMLDLAIAAQDPQERQAIRERLDAPRESASLLDADRQRRLDELTNEWLATMEVGPVWRFGLVPASFDWLTARRQNVFLSTSTISAVTISDVTSVRRNRRVGPAPCSSSGRPDRL